MTTQVKCTCVSKKESKSWSNTNPIQTEIELQPPYDQTSVYWQMSGGTNLLLKTVNQIAADMFEIGGEYMVSIRPAEQGE